MSYSNLTQKRVFFIWDGSLFGEGVKQILEQDTDLLVTDVNYSEDPAFLAHAEELPSDVILVCDSGFSDLNSIFDVASAQKLVMGLLIIFVRLSQNMIDVYANASFVDGKISGKPEQAVPMTQRALLNMLKRNNFGW